MWLQALTNSNGDQLQMILTPAYNVVIEWFYRWSRPFQWPMWPPTSGRLLQDSTSSDVTHLCPISDPSLAILMFKTSQQPERKNNLHSKSDSFPPLQILLHFSNSHVMSFLAQFGNNQQNISFSVALFSTTYGRILGHSSSLVTLRISEERRLRHSVHIFNNNATVIKFISTLANHKTNWACLIKLHCRNFTIVCK